MTPVIGDEAFTELTRDRFLQLRIDGGADGKAAFVELFLAIHVEEFTADLLHEIGSVADLHAAAAKRDFEIGAAGFGRFIGGDEALLLHAGDDPVAPRERAFAVAIGVVVVRALGKRGEIGGLGDGEFVERLAEIVERGGGDTVGADAEIDLVQIELEDLVLGESLFEADRDQRLFQLAVERDVGGKQEVLGDLLRDRGGADEAAVLHDVHDIVEDGADDAHRIDAAMAVEILVLGREEGIDHAGRNGGDGNVEAALAREFADEFAVARMHAGHDRRFVIGEPGIVRQILIEAPDHVAARHQPAEEKHQADGRNDRKNSQHRASCPHSINIPAPDQ